MAIFMRRSLGTIQHDNLPIPPNENERLNVFMLSIFSIHRLRRFLIVTRLVARVLDVPIALLFHWLIRIDNGSSLVLVAGRDRNST